jgi:O-antigen ligase
VQYAKLNSFAWRMLLWEYSLDWMSKANSIFGYGMNSFKHYSPLFFPLAGTTNFGAHNTYIQWYFEAGVVGLLAAAWMHFRIFITLKAGALKTMATEEKLRSAIAVMLVIGYLFFAFSDNMLDYLSFNWYFWFFIGAACAIAVISQAEEPVTEAVQPNPIRQARSEYVQIFFRSNRKK